MDIQTKLLEDMKAAMKSGDKVRLETIRGLRSQIKNEEINKKDSLSDDEVLQVLSTAVKRRKESIEMARAGNRPERAEEETREMEIILEYLPKQMTAEEISSLVDQVVQEVRPESPRDMGKVMGKLMPQVKGRADGKLVQQIVQQKLAGL